MFLLVTQWSLIDLFLDRLDEFLWSLVVDRGGGYYLYDYLLVLCVILC